MTRRFLEGFACAFALLALGCGSPPRAGVEEQFNLWPIARYETASADVTVDRIEALVRETGETGFHFVDEAAPPAALRALAEKIIERKLAITWWGNIRFEKTFDLELTGVDAFE